MKLLVFKYCVFQGFPQRKTIHRLTRYIYVFIQKKRVYYISEHWVDKLTLIHNNPLQ